MKNHRILTSSLALFAAALPSHADYFWDGDIDFSVDSDGGSGTWDTGTLNWDTLATGGTDTTWSASENAVFGGTAGIVSVATGGISAAGLTFGATGYTLQGAPLTLGTGIITTGPGIEAIITAPVAGTAGLTKSGDGTLILAGASTYAGATTVQAGTLKTAPTPGFRYYRFTGYVNSGNDGYNQLGEIHFYKDGVWVPAVGGSYGPVPGSPGAEQTWVVANDDRGSAASFTKFGLNARPYSVTFDYGSTIALDSYNWSTGNDSTPGRNPKRWAVFGSHDNVNFTLIDDRSNTEQSGPGATYTWAGATGTYEAVVNGTGGTAFATGSGAANAYPIAWSGIPAAASLSIAGGSTFDLNGLNQFTTTIDGSGLLTNTGTRPVLLRMGSGASADFGGAIADAGPSSALSLVKIGAGAQTLSGPDGNTYSGATTLGGTGKLVLAKTGGAIAIPGNVTLSSTAFGGNNAGLVLAGDEQIADTAIVSWSPNAYGLTVAQTAIAPQADCFFRLNGHTETIGGLVTSNTSAVPVIENRGFNDATSYGTGTLILDVTATTHTYSGQIRDADASTNGAGGKIALTKVGPGTQVLAGNMSACTGPTLVGEGVLRINNLLGSSTVTVTEAGILEGTGTLSGLVTIQSGGMLSPGVAGAGTLNAANPVTITSGGILSLAGTTLNGAANITDGGLLTGTGTISSTLNVESGGALAPGATGIGVLNANGSVDLAGNATFEINKTGAIFTSDRVSGFSKVTYGGTLTVIFTGDAPALGDVYTLFTAGAGGTYAGGFSGITGLPTLPSGLQWETTSLLTDGTIKVINTASSPAFGPAAGGYVGAQTVTLTSDGGSTIYYTTDGSEPTLESLIYDPLFPPTIPVDAVVTVKAFAVTSGFASSPVVTAIYRTVTVPKWNVDAAGNWSTATNWANEVIPNGNQMTADFTLTQTADRTVTLDTNRTIGGLAFANDQPFNWTLARSGSNVLTLNVPSGSPVIDVQDIAGQDPDTTLSGVLAGIQGFTKTGPGVLALTGSNTFGGTLNVTGGTISVATLTANGSNSPLGSGSILGLDGGTLRYSGTASINFGTFNRSVILGEEGGTIDASNQAGYWFTAGPFSGPGSLTKVGARQLIVQSNNTYDGDTFINEAELQIRTVDGLGSTVGKTVVNSPARLGLGTNIAGTINETLELNGLGGGGGAFQCNDGGVVVNWTGPITLVTDSGIGGGAAGLTLSGPISGDGALIKLGTNAITIAGASSNTCTGLTTLGGTGKLVLAKTDGAIAIPGNIDLSSTAFGGNNSGIVLAGSEQIANGAILTWTPTAFGGGAQQDSFFRLNGHTETIGGLNATGLGFKAAIENRGNGDTTTYGTGSLVIHTTGTSSYSYNGGIRDMDGGTGGGSIALTKTGTGTQVLNGGLSYTGATTVAEGTLEIDAFATSPISVSSGATLKGSGATSSTLTVVTGGILAPGITIGTFGAGNTSIAGSYACEIDGATADRLTVTGSLDLTGATLDFTVLNAPTAGGYVLASYTTDLTGTFAVTGLPAGYSVEYLEATKQIVLVKPSFGGWAFLNGLSGNPDDDFDNDGLADALEYVLGSSPTAADGGAPVGTLEGGNLVFTFNRDRDSLTDDVAVRVEVGTNLTLWPDLYPVGEESGGGIVVTDNGTSDTITLSVPQGTDLRKFARLVVTVTP